MTQLVEQKLAGILGLCMKAGQLETGQDKGVELIRNGGAGIVLIDTSASENTKKRIGNACHFHQVPVYEMDGGIIGHSLGKSGIYVAVIKNGGFTEKLLPQLQDEKIFQPEERMNIKNEYGGVIATCRK